MKVKVDNTVYTNIRNLSFAPQVNISGFELPINEITVDITADVGYGKFLYLQSDGGKNWCKFWISRTENLGDGYYRVIARDVMALLDRVEMQARYYGGETVSQAISGVFYEVSQALPNANLYFADVSGDVSGFAPKQTARERLQWICFTKGLTVKTVFCERNNTTYCCTIAPIDTVVTNISSANVYYKPQPQREDDVKTVSIMSYSFTEGTPAETDEWVKDYFTEKVYIVEASRYTAHNPNQVDDVPKEVAVDDCMMITGTGASILTRMGGYYFNPYRTISAEILETDIENLSCVPGDRITIDIGGELICGYIEESTFTFGKACKQSVKISRMDATVERTTVEVVITREELVNGVEHEEYVEWVIDDDYTVRDYLDDTITVIYNGVELPISEFPYTTKDEIKIYEVGTHSVYVENNRVVSVIRRTEETADDIEWGFPSESEFEASLPIVTVASYNSEGDLYLMSVYVPMVDTITGEAGDTLQASYFLAYEANYETGIANVWGGYHCYKYNDVNVVITDKTISQSGVILGDLVQEECIFPLSSAKDIWVMRGSSKIHLRLEDIEITENGEYLPEILGFKYVRVNVPLNITTGYINANGSHSAPGDGWSSVTVNVEKNNKVMAKKITEPGRYTPDTGYIGFSSVDVDIEKAWDYKYECGAKVIDRYGEGYCVVDDDFYRKVMSDLSGSFDYYYRVYKNKNLAYSGNGSNLTLQVNWGCFRFDYNNVKYLGSYIPAGYISFSQATMVQGGTIKKTAVPQNIGTIPSPLVFAYNNNIHFIFNKKHYRISVADFISASVPDGQSLVTANWQELEDSPAFFDPYGSKGKFAVVDDVVYLAHANCYEQQGMARIYKVPQLWSYTEEQTQQGESRTFKKVIDYPNFVAEAKVSNLSNLDGLSITDYGLMLFCTSEMNVLEDKEFVDRLPAESVEYYNGAFTHCFLLQDGRWEDLGILPPTNATIHFHGWRGAFSCKGKTYLDQNNVSFYENLSYHDVETQTGADVGLFELKKLYLKE